MPTVTLNKTIFEQLVGKSLTLEQLKDRISMLGTDLESIEGNQINVEIFPNRPDMLSEQGFARAFSSFIGVKTGLRKYTLQKSNLNVKVDKSVAMRPYTACAIIKNLKLNDEKIRELMQIQEKLATTHGRNRKKSGYGIYPLNAITFPIHYIAKDPKTIEFQPLGFNEILCANQIPLLHPKGKAYANITKEWTKYPFFIDAKNNILSMLPFTNSHQSGKVTPQTKDVFIECSGTDLHNVQIALNIITTALIDMGGTAYSLDIIYPTKTITTPNFTPRSIKLDQKYINLRLGLQLKEKDFKTLLERMGYGYQKNTVLIPCYRNDILHQVDLMEDIAIAYGYENFKEEIPNVATIGQEAALETFLTKVRHILVGLNMLEVKSYHLMMQQELTQQMSSLPQPQNQPNHKISPQPIQSTATQIFTPPITLKNAVGDFNTLRNSVIPSLLKISAQNQHHEYPQKIFEIGRIFQKDTQNSTDTGIVETETLCVSLSHETADLTEIRQILDALCLLLDIKINIKETTNPFFINGRAGSILLNNESIGTIGEIHPQILTNRNITMPIVTFELNLEKLFEKMKNKRISR